MRNKLLTLAGALALLVVFGKFYATPLLAQVRAALVKNIDERGRIPYQATGSCVSAQFDIQCAVVFPAVPAGKRVVIEHVSVDMTGLASSSSVPALALFQDISGGALDTLPVFFRFGGAAFDYGSNETVLLFVEAGHQPKVQASFVSSVNAATVSGYIVDLTQ